MSDIRKENSKMAQKLVGLEFLRKNEIKIYKMHKKVYNKRMNSLKIWV